jgi:hypothetical protein
MPPILESPNGPSDKGHWYLRVQSATHASGSRAHPCRHDIACKAFKAPDHWPLIRLYGSFEQELIADGRDRSRPAAADCGDCRLRARGDGALDAESPTRRHWGYEGYDLNGILQDPCHQTGPAEKSQIRVQVKSRYATDFDHGFPVKEKSLNAFDSSIAVLLNIGNFYGRNDGSTGAQDSEFFTHSQTFIREHHELSSTWEICD